MDDIFDKCNEAPIGSAIQDPDERELAMKLIGGVSPVDNIGPHIESDGETFIQFSSNDYLGIAGHPQVRERAAEIVRQHGIAAPMGSRLMAGNTAYHVELESHIADFKRCEAALTFTTGAGAMIGSLACLVDNRDLLILDERVHASLRCGAKVTGAPLRFFRHNDMDHLDQILSDTREFPSRAVVVDGVYSMDGDVANFNELAALKKTHGFRLIVDDAHGTGVFGENGRGAAAHFGVDDQVDLHLGTFSKAIGTIGGFVAGDLNVIRFISTSAPTFVFTKAMPLVTAVATKMALDLLEKADDARLRLWANARRLQASLTAAGFDIGKTQSPITPIRFPGNSALYVAQELRENYGIWTAPVLYPAVEPGASLLRLVPTANHDEEHIQQLVEALFEVRQTLGEIVSPTPSNIDKSS
jgi:8-amino-7-oxononanoate synthase